MRSTYVDWRRNIANYFGQSDNHLNNFHDYAGMNTGIQDAHNLAWKIASLVKGIAPSSLLETYETERKPVLLFLYIYILVPVTISF
jgi:hypothetical protein